MAVTEGRIPFHGAETWYRSLDADSEDGRLPLLCLTAGRRNWGIQPGVQRRRLAPRAGLAVAGPDPGDHVLGHTENVGGLFLAGARFEH